MNRADRRKIAKQGVTSKDLKIIEQDAKDRGISDTTQAILSCLVLELHDKWGWGMTRITRLLGQIDERFDSVNKGYLSIEDLKQTVHDELGIDIR